jgi:DNA polymerase elongation subunit (family B)
MDDVPDAPAFKPLGLPGGVYRGDDWPATTRADFLTPAPLGNRLVFSLFTITVEEGRTYTVPAGDVGAAAMASESELAYMKAGIDAMRDGGSGGGRAGGAGGGGGGGGGGAWGADSMPETPDTTVYVTGHLADGRKVGLVTRYRPYCEVELPDGAGVERWFEREVVDAVARACQVATARLTVAFHRAPRFYGYVPDPANPLQRKRFLFARLSFPNTALMRRGASAMRADYGRPLRLRSAGSAPVFRVYEDGIDTVQKFVDTYRLVPCGWHEWAPLAALRPRRQREMLVDLEYEVEDARLLRYLGKDAPAAGDPEPSSVPPLLIAVLDAEMNSGYAGRMPRAFRPDNCVITVSVVYAFCGTVPGKLAVDGAAGVTAAGGAAAGVTGAGVTTAGVTTAGVTAAGVTTAGVTGGAATPEYVEFERHAYVLAAECEPIPGVIVHLYGDEYDMLAAIRDDMFIRKKVDVVAGHNLIRFDMEYLASRVQEFAPDGARRFMRFGVLFMQTLLLEAGDLSSSAYGSNRLSKLDGAGFVYVDTLLICKTSFKLRQNTLNYAAAHFLKDVAKFDMPYDLIPAVAAGANAAHWRKLAAYCVQDSVMVLRLLGKWDSIKDLVAQSRIMNIPMAANVSCGQMERVRDYVMRDAHGPAFGMVMNGVNVRSGKREDDGSEHTSAVGGWVLDNIQGLHDCPILVLDFASLYPSVQDSKNLCWSTCVEAGSVTPAHIAAGLEVETHVTATGTFQFVTNVPGVFPQSLRALRHERNQYKGEMKKHAYGTAAYQNADNAQKAIKIPMNSGYGTANCPRSKGGKMECIPLGTTTCHVGRQLNQLAAAYVKEHFAAEIIYGDTDSIMFRVPLAAGGSRKERLVEAMAVGHAAEEAINAHLNTLLNTTAVKVEFEKAYYPFLSSGKKTYAGLKFEPGDEARADADLQTGGRIECKGLRTVRRDVPQFVAKMTETLLAQLFFQRDEDAFWDTVHTYAEKLAAAQLPLEAYVITAELKSGYDTKASLSAQAAVSYAREYLKPGNGFQDGDRVPFVFVEQADTRRTVRPPWLDADIAASRKVAEDSRQERWGGREVPAVSAVVAAAPAYMVPTQPAFLSLEGESVDDKKCKHARHPDEVAADPAHNTLNMQHYMDCICAVLEQLMPQAQGAQKELREYARAHKAYAQSLRGSSSGGGLGAILGGGGGGGGGAGSAAAAAANLPKLSHRKPAVVSRGSYTLFGGTCVVDDKKAKKKSVRKPPPLKPALKQRSLLDMDKK